MRMMMLFWEYLKNYAKSKLAYRTDFWIEVFSDLLQQGINLVIILIMFQHTTLLGGWSQPEVIFVYGFFMVPFGLFSMFFNMWNFGERYIIKGEMDRILTRPAHSLFQVMLENIDPPSIVGSIIGMFVMASCLPYLDLHLTVLDGFIFIVLVVGAVLVYGGIYTMLSAISFFSDSPTGIVPLIYNVQSYGRYPINIYNKIIRFVLTWVVPFAFVGIIPASYFLDEKTDNISSLALLTPVIGIIFFGLSLVLWNYGVRKYRGAGS